MSTQPGETITICVGRSGGTAFGATATVQVVGNALPHLAAFGTQTLSFQPGQAQACFGFTLGSEQASASYKLGVIGSEARLELGVEMLPAQAYCGVFSNAASSNFNNSEAYTFSDRFGNRYTAGELAFDPAGVVCTSSGHFLLDFSDNFTPNEISTICQAFADVSALVVASQTNIPIRVRKMNLGDERVLGAATAFWREASPSGGCGIESNLVWEHINTDMDFNNILPANYSAGELRINSIGIGWHTLAMDGPGGFVNPAVAAANHDLYSLTLHEAMHLLGFESRITPNGSPMLGFYSIWDKRLRSGATADSGNQPLIQPTATDPACCDQHGFNPAAGIAPASYDPGCGGLNPLAVYFHHGPLATDAATVFGEYEPGEIPDAAALVTNTLSHLNDDCDGEAYVMHARLGAGNARRTLADQETAILCSLGYTLTDAETSSCTAPCEVVVMDDYVTSGFSTVEAPNSISITIPFSQLLANDYLSEGTPTLTFADCDPFINLDYSIPPSSQFPSVTFRGMISGYSHTFCYTVTLPCGACDEGYVILIPNTQPPPVLPDGPECGSLENLLPWGDFEDFELPQSINDPDGFFELLNLDQCDPLGINSAPGTLLENTPGIISTGGGANYVGYLRGRILSSTNIFNESLYMPLSQPIFPGCTASISLDIMTHSNQFVVGDIGNIQIYGSYLAPCNMPGVANCGGPVTPDGFQCLVSGIPILSPMSSFVNFGGYTWTNNTPYPIRYIVVANNALAIAGGNTQDNGSVLVDNITVTQDCANELTITSTVLEACEDGLVRVSYELCLNGDNPAPADVALTLTLPDYPGISFGGGDFQTTEYTLEGLVPNGTCQTLTLELDISGSPLVAGNTLGITLDAVANSACLENPVQTDVVLEVCLPPFTCDDCTPAAIIGTPGETLTLPQAVAEGLPAGTVAVGANLCIAGTLRIRQGEQYAFKGCNVRMLEGASIEVENGGALAVVDNTAFFGCEKLWQGIVVQRGGSVKMSGSTIADAYCAVDATPYTHDSQPHTIVELVDMQFYNNFLGLYVRPVGYSAMISIVAGNHFFAGQDPLFSGEVALLPGLPAPNDKPLAGIVVNGLRLFASTNNRFTSLASGLLSYNAQVAVQGNNFNGMDGAAYPGFGPGGIGVFADRNANNFMGTVVRGSIFQQCRIGIAARYSALDATGNTMQGVQDGISTNLPNEGLVRIGGTVSQANNLHCDRSGILAAGFAFNTDLDIGNNYVVLGNDGAFGIHLAASQSQNADLHDNDLVLNGSGTALNLLNTQNLRVEGNQIALNNSPLARAGMRLRGAEDCLLHGNAITGSGTGGQDGFNLGMEVFSSPGLSYCCNTLHNTRLGVQVLGSSMSTDNFRGTTFGTHHTGLRIEDGALLGTQTHAENRWTGIYTSGFGARYEVEEANANQFPFVVDNAGANGNALYNTSAFPVNWFDLEDNPSPQYYCQQPMCSFSGIQPPKPDDELLVQGGGILDGFSDAIGWQLQKRSLRQYNQPGGAVPSSVIGQVSQMNQADYGAFLTFEDNVKNVFLLDATTLSQVNGLMDEQRNLLDDLLDADRSFEDGGGNTLSASQLLERQEMSTEALSINSSLLPLSEAVTASRNSQAQTLLSQSLPNGQTYTAYLEQTGKALLANGITPWVPAPQETLEDLSAIANACPLEDGNAVFEAQALLAMLAGQAPVYELDDCGKEKGKAAPAPKSRQTLHAPAGLYAYPNPSGGNGFTVGWPASDFAGPVSLRLYALGGELILEKAVDADMSSTYLFVPDLPAGIYLLQVAGVERVGMLKIAVK